MIENIKDILWIIATLLGTYKVMLEIRNSKKVKKKKRPNRKKGRKKK